MIPRGIVVSFEFETRAHYLFIYPAIIGICFRNKHRKFINEGTLGLKYKETLIIPTLHEYAGVCEGRRIMSPRLRLATRNSF